MIFNVFLYTLRFPLLYKEWLAEWRNPYQLGGLLSFLSAVCFLVYFFMGKPDPKSWNFMFWLVFLFLGFFAAARVFEEDNLKYRFYNLTLYKPLQLFWAKALYLSGLLWSLGILLLLLMNILAPIDNGWGLLWMPLLLLVSFGLAIMTCFTAFLSSHGNTRQLLMVGITLPLCFPLVGMAFSSSLLILQGTEVIPMVTKCIPIFAMDLLAISLVLFILPLVWKN